MKLKLGEIYTHKPSCNNYKLLMVTNLDATNNQSFVPTAVYEDKHGSLWSRPLTEFKDKFILK